MISKLTIEVIVRHDGRCRVRSFQEHALFDSGPADDLTYDGLVLDEAVDVVDAVLADGLDGLRRFLDLNGHG
jgi:hypothetical protein